MIAARNRTYFYLTMKYVETPRRIGWYFAAFDSVWGVFPELLSSSVAKNTTVCDSSGCDMSFLGAKKAEITYRSFAVLPCWVYASALPKDVFTQVKAPFTFPTEIFLKLF